MARPKEFDREVALDSAIGVFREHGFAATSTSMLTSAMKIGRQSLYDTFGDKWQLYCQAVQRYTTSETHQHLAMLAGGRKAFDGIELLIERVVTEAHQPCLGIGAVNEFGNTSDELVRLRDTAGRKLRSAISAKICAAQKDGDIPPGLNAEHAADFLLANVAAIRISARGGATKSSLSVLGKLVLRALQ